jgi:hypothetical protein
MKVALETSQMPADRRPVSGPKRRLLTRDALDGRTRARKLFDSIVAGIESDLGGRERLSTVEVALIEAFAGATVHVHDLNARLMLGQKIDLTQHSAAIGSLVRIASRLGTGRRPRDVTPTLQEYLRTRAVDSDEGEPP